MNATGLTRDRSRHGGSIKSTFTVDLDKIINLNLMETPSYPAEGNFRPRQEATLSREREIGRESESFESSGRLYCRTEPSRGAPRR